MDSRVIMSDSLKLMKKKTDQSPAGATSFCKYFLCSKPLWGLIGMDVMRRQGNVPWLYT